MNLYGPPVSAGNMDRGSRIVICAALFLVLAFWHFLIALMFLPTMIAFCRPGQNWALMLMLNVFLGWSPVWVLMMAWVLWSQPPVPPAPPLPRDAVKVTVKANVNYNQKKDEIII